MKMTRFMWFALALLLAAGTLLAQAPTGGNGLTMGTSTTGGTIMLNTADGLFALRAGVIAKYDSTTLHLVKELELFGPMPDAPADNTDRTAMQQYMSELQRRTAPAVMIAKDNALIIVVGDGFARINQQTLKVEATGDVSPLDKTSTTDTGRGGFRMEAAPGVLLTGNTLYLMRSKEVLSVSITTGKVLARTALGKELQPVPIGNLFGGGRGGGNRGGGGNYGGPRGGQQNTPPAD